MFRGKEFFTVFMQNSERGTRANLQLLFTSYSNSTQVTVTQRGGTFAHTVALGRDETVSLSVPGHVEHVGNWISDKAILIQATEEISVVSISSKRYTMGATTVLPVGALGNKYYVVTPKSVGSDGLKEFVVAAGKTSASVSITVKGEFRYNGKKYSPGSTLRIVLNPYHSFQLQSGQDLSGTEITSDNAVAVFSGHSCVKIHTGCDYVVEQLLPVAAWGTAYVVPPNPFQYYVDLVYVVAAEKASITCNRGSVAVTEDIEAGEVHEFEISQNSPLYVNASAPIQVVFFFTGARKSWYNRDPFLLNIPPVSTYCTSYRVRMLAGYENHVVLTARNEDASTFALNQKTEGTMSWEAIPGTNFSYTFVTMSKAVDIQSAEHRQTPFGLLVFGFKNYAGYGLAGLCTTRK